MDGAVNKIFEDKTYDISSYTVTFHALTQYSTKCSNGGTLLEVTEKIKNKMRTLKKVELNKKKVGNRDYYMDEDEVIYITEKNTIITVFPNERIFISKTFYTNRKTGQKYL